MSKADFDIIQKTIGDLGKWHILVCILICLVKFPIAWIQLSIVFIAPPPTFTCSDNTTNKCDPNCPLHIYDRSVFTETIITQWDLVCDKAYLANLAQMLTMLGILFGNLIFGYFSDKFGRRIPLIWAIIIKTVCGITSSFIPWFIPFLILRFLSALAVGGTMVISFVLIMEMIGIKWRTTIGILYQIPFNVGHLSLPIFAYFIRDWRYFHTAIIAPTILLISYYWILPESPRWLLTVGKKDKAIKILQKAAKINKMTETDIKDDVELYTASKNLDQEPGNILDLVKTPTMRLYTTCIGYNWLVCGLCFFGSAQYIGQLGGNIFINVALSAITQIPSTFFAIWAIKVLGRKKTLICGNLLSAISCLLIGLTPSHVTWLRSGLSCIDMFGLAVSFPTVYIYSGELFPTVIRNVGVGTSSMFARIGSMAAPFIAGLVEIKAWLPPVVFGITPLIGAFLCLKLPETLDCKLPDTIEEAEDLNKRKN